MNNTRKRSSMMVRLVAVLAVTMMFTMCFVGGTFAKYTSSATGTDRAKVAKWSFEVNDTEIATTQTFTFNLFDTIKDSNGTDNEADMSFVDGSIIAPGTQGSFQIKLENLSEVNATYAIDYTVTNTSNIPVQFSVDNGAHWTDGLVDVPATNIAHTDGTATITVQWRWRFEADNVTEGDNADTNLGKDGTATLEVSAKVTATQVD